VTTPDKPVDVPLSIQAHNAETARLNSLVGFVEKFAPAIAESRQTGTLADVEASPLVTITRERALIASFRAIKRIARMSFKPPENHP
jgi:hypothetical protein